MPRAKRAGRSGTNHNHPPHAAESRQEGKTRPAAAVIRPGARKPACEAPQTRAIRRVRCGIRLTPVQPDAPGPRWCVPVNTINLAKPPTEIPIAGKSYPVRKVSVDTFGLRHGDTKLLVTSVNKPLTGDVAAAYTRIILALIGPQGEMTLEFLGAWLSQFKRGR